MSEERSLNTIWPNHKNPRRSIANDPGFLGLVESIRSQGILQPLLINSDGMILAGHRRYEAAVKLGLPTVPVRILPDTNSHDLVPLIENLQRTDLSVLEVADYLLLCRRQHGLMPTAISEIVGISAGTIAGYIKLAEGPPEIRERIESGQLTLGAALALLPHEKEVIQEILKEPHLTRDVVRERAKTINLAKPVSPSEFKDRLILAPPPCPKERIAHLKYAMKVVRELLTAAPDEAFATRYRRWLNVMEDDLHDAPDITDSYRGSIDHFQRQPKARPA